MGQTISPGERMTTAALAVINESVTPILISKDGETRQEGTGTFFQIGEHRLMVSASHVFGKVAEGWKPTVLDAGKEGEPLKEAQLVGKTVRFPDPYDIAISLVDPQTVATLPNRKFLTLSSVDLSPVLPGHFVIGGFPTCLGFSSEKPQSLGGCLVCTELYTGPTATFSGYDPEWHILLGRMDGIGCMDKNRKPIALPDSLRGASGAPVLQTIVMGDSPQDWNPDCIRVAGVVTGEWREAFGATRWAAVLLCIVSGLPELRDSVAARGLDPRQVRMPAAIYRI